MPSGHSAQAAPSARSNASFWREHGGRGGRDGGVEDQGGSVFWVKKNMGRKELGSGISLVHHGSDQEIQRFHKKRKRVMLKFAPRRKMLQ